MFGLKQMSEAPKPHFSDEAGGGPEILAKLKSEMPPPYHHWRREDWKKTWGDRWVVIHHPGLAEDGFDVGWSVFQGYGGLPDEWFEGWIPLPTAIDDEGTYAINP